MTASNGDGPLLEIRDLVKYFPIKRGRSSGRPAASTRSTVSRSASTRVRRSGWWASRAAGSRLSAAASSACSSRPLGKSSSAAGRSRISRGALSAASGELQIVFQTPTRASTRASASGRSSGRRSTSTNRGPHLTPQARGRHAEDGRALAGALQPLSARVLRAVSASASGSRVRLRSNRRCWSPTSRSRPWTSPSRPR